MYVWLEIKFIFKLNVNNIGILRNKSYNYINR